MSTFSDCDSALPDLEVDPAIVNIINDKIEVEVDPMENAKETQSVDVLLNTNPEELSVIEKKEIVLQEIDERNQMLKDGKAWIQNTLLTVVGFGVLAYLQTLETSMS